MSTTVRWGFVFLACPIRLEEDQKLALVRLAARAYFHDEGLVRFDWPGLTGEVRVASDCVTLGSFVGQRFEAEVHTHDQQATLRFLVTERQLQAMGGVVAEA